ncbi:hypothetical protein [Aquimarina pacifica]|uniref:hypothetical protein n=1 Tax=Aquimarina pacifica TaxID=1296415 RepID=UPI00047125BA|nr:hypothetical protein [Aquimarina pacifica]
MKNYKIMQLGVLLMLFAIQWMSAQETLNASTFGDESDLYIINSDEGENDAALRIQTKIDVGDLYNDWVIWNNQMNGDLNFSVFRSPTHDDTDESNSGEVHLKINKEGVVSVKNLFTVGTGTYLNDVSMIVGGGTHIGRYEGYSSLSNIEDQYQLFVEKGIVSDTFYLSEVPSWADYVFSKDYKLPSLASVENFIQKNGHLPEVPSEKEILTEGYQLHDMNVTFLQKIEELTLYTIQQRKLLEQLLDNVEKNNQ